MLHVPFIKHDDRNEATNSRTMHRPLIILSYTRRGKDQSTSRKKPLLSEDVSACVHFSESKKNQASIKKTT